jgi:hypothetical protein
METNATKQQVEEAIERVNKQHGYQIEFNNWSYPRNGVFRFTIKSKKSGIPGARYSSSGRKLISASWHTHGYVMDEIFDINPECYIRSLGEKYYKGFEWKDMNIGSMMNPVNASELSIL